MPDEEEGIEVGDSLESSDVDLRKLDGSNLRLDAIHYAPSYLRAVAKVKKSGFRTEPLASFAARPPFTCGRFKRIYVRDPDRGHPYLAPYELMNFKPFRERYLSKKLTEDAEKFYVKDGWLLITASGTVGVPIIATKEKEGYFLSHDLIRIVPKDDAPTGYLYAWLASKTAKPLFMRQEYGGIIKHLEAHQVNGLPVPMAPKKDLELIDGKVRRAWALREEANRLEQDAIAHLDGLFQG